MARVLHYFAHPGVRFSKTNNAMWSAARDVEGITHVDLYADYPHRYINVSTEQQRLLDHDVVLFQFPVFWYSCPALVKEWIDLTLERGWAYGDGGDKLAGKYLMLAVTTGGDEHAYSADGYQRYPLRTFLTPFEQTARLCHMTFLAPYVQFAALSTEPDDHVAGFTALLRALREDTFDLAAAQTRDVITHADIPTMQEV